MDGLRRVVITGIGVLSSCGKNVEQFWSSLIEGQSGIDRITAFDPTAFPSQIAGGIKDFNALEHFNSKEVKKMDRMIQFAVVASRQAMKDSGIILEKEDLTRIGVLFGSGIGGLSTIETEHNVYLSRGPTKITPFFIPMEIVDMTSGIISIEFHAKGPNFSIVSACATGSHCIGESARIISTGDADVIITGAAEAAITPLGMGGFCSMKALSRNNENPKSASRPFDLNRDGFVMAEGSGALILEEYEHATSRGAKIYGELIGYGLSGDAYHITQPAPEGEGAVRAINMALKKARINPEAIDYYNAHGTSTKYNDEMETLAVKNSFGSHAKKVPVSSTKSITGHMLAAAGAVELIAVVKAMETGLIPPTWNLTTPDPACDLDYVPNCPREANLNICMSNSLGFGGHNATLIVKKM
ncbi:MAG: beta-ketoacyl-ACP synthase II [Candidatus Aureabacteria bacterium]|nr:beta-ketoacyl-ACP synthase II [Candidatus Auribacterota bacterium]